MNYTPQDLVLLGGTVALLALAAWRLPRGNIGRFRLVAGPLLGCAVAGFLALVLEGLARELLRPKQVVTDLFIFAAAISAVEELLRAVVFVVVRRRSSLVGDPREWITQGIIVGLAFSLIENLVFAEGRRLDWYSTLLRLGITTASHAAYAGVFAVGSAKRNFEGKSAAGRAALLTALALHATFDFAGFSVENLRSPPNELLVRALQIVIVYGSLGFVWLKTQRFSANARTSKSLGEPVA